VARDKPHLMAALRYVALNSVKAKRAMTAADEPWSSTPAHLRSQDGGLVTVRPLLDRVDRFADFLAVPADPERVAALTKGQAIGRPLMGDQALGELEKRLGRTLRPGKRGRLPSQKNDPRQLKLV
jgi:putative transposase